MTDGRRSVQHQAHQAELIRDARLLMTRLEDELTLLRDGRWDGTSGLVQELDRIVEDIGTALAELAP